jgi:hypothetical protein
VYPAMVSTYPAAAATAYAQGSGGSMVTPAYPAMGATSPAAIGDGSPVSSSPAGGGSGAGGSGPVTTQVPSPTRPPLRIRPPAPADKG